MVVESVFVLFSKEETMDANTLGTPANYTPESLPRTLNDMHTSRASMKKNALMLFSDDIRSELLVLSDIFIFQIMFSTYFSCFYGCLFVRKITQRCRKMSPIWQKSWARDGRL
jgi:hypothetical protein